MTKPENTQYTIETEVKGTFHEVVEQATDALSEQGFGVLCDIDVQQKFEKKLDEQFSQYRILGACNPPLAYQALNEEIQLGALLPCNVVVYETEEGAIKVSAVDPEKMLSVVDNPELDDIASEVQTRLERVLAELPEP